MPVLAEEPDCFPPDLFNVTPPVDPRLWWVAHTRPRQEKAVARQLLTAALPYYLPCQRKRIRVGGRVLTSTVPLFAGYVFVRLTHAEKWRVMATNRVASLLQVTDQDQLGEDLRRVRSVLDLGRPVSSEVKLVPGTVVTLRDGPLTGMTGILIREVGGFKFIVQVDFIQQGVSVTVDGAWLGVAA
jgi:transcriptional antiterminator RfaH